MEKKSITIPKINGFQDIDRFAEGCISMKNWKEYQSGPEVSFRIGYTDTAIHILFDVRKDHARAVYMNSNEAVYEDSCVEFFVKEPGSGFYFNFETNCIGTSLAAKRRSRTDFTHLTEEQIGAVTRKSSLPHKPTDMKDASWTLELTIPFATIGLEHVPDRLEANLYKCGDKTDPVHFLSWSGIDTETPDFHRPEFFGELIFKK